MSKILVDKCVLKQALEAWDQPHGINYVDFRPYMEAIRAALAEPVQEPDPGEYHGWVLREVLFEKGEPVGHREPVQEPVAWRFQSAVGSWAYGSEPPLGSKYPVYPLYAAPPQHKPLTDEEIAECKKAVPVLRDITLGYLIHFARAIERAHEIGE